MSGRQQGNITTEQLLALGLWPRSIAHRVRRGSLHREHRGVYSVGRPAKTPLEKAAAAVLACGPEAVLSHSSAMTNWGLWKRWDLPFEVTVPKVRKRQGIRTHRSLLHRRDIAMQHGIRTTSRARTLLDMAPRLTPKQLSRAVNEALSTGYLKVGQLAEVVARYPNHLGARRLGPFIADAHHGITRSELEDLFKTFCQRYGLPTPKFNVIVNGYLVDAYFEAERLIVELDGWGFHSTRINFEKDRNRDADQLSNDIATVRITHDRMTGEPDHEAVRLRKIMRGRRR